MREVILSDNVRILAWLFETGQIDLKRGALFDVSPGPLPQGFDFDRVEGMMLGLAVGDALGNTSESMLPEQRRARYGEIRDYLPNRYADDRPVGLPSDDTQMAFWTLDQMITDGEFKPERVAERFCGGEIFGIGGTVKGFIANYKAGLDWYRCGPKSAGNGALMRIAPMLIPHIRSGSSDVWVDTALSAMMTHNDSASTAACVSFVHMLWRLLMMDAAPAPDWWLETYVAVAQELECDESYHPRDGAFTEYQGLLWRFVQDKVSWAYRQGLSVREACDLWYSGAFLLETVP
ncbi:MAG: ADP-ribosylglycohydrolase family protein, partial [Anaerolineae bacterium]|nr:ADP-ribosylglycohydrolase family protein [Anaerolineae bacterium]